MQTKEMYMYKCSHFVLIINKKKKKKKSISTLVLFCSNITSEKAVKITSCFIFSTSFSTHSEG